MRQVANSTARTQTASQRSRGPAIRDEAEKSEDRMEQAMKKKEKKENSACTEDVTDGGGDGAAVLHVHLRTEKTEDQFH